MSINFRKTKSFGGAKVSFGKKGISSVSFGGKGARVSINTNGKINQTVGIPGTGIYSQSTISGSKKNQQRYNSANDIYSSSGKNPKPPKKHVIFLIIGILVLVLTAFWSFGMFTSQDFSVLSFSLLGFFLSIGLFFLSLYGVFRHKKLMCVLCAILFVVSFGVAMVVPSSDNAGTESTVSTVSTVSESSSVESDSGNVDNDEQSDSTSNAQTEETTTQTPADTSSVEEASSETTTSQAAPSTAPVIDTPSVEESSQAPVTDTPSAEEPQVTTPPATQERTVWIPTKGGTKYHRNSSCSGMEDPREVSVSEAEASGFEPCKRCY